MPIAALIIAVIFFLAGLLGTFLPVLPGAILIFAGMLLYGFLTDFTALTLNFFLLQAMAVILVYTLDFAATVLGTRRFGGGRAAAAGAVVGAILGLIFLGPFGIIVGPFAGAVAGEMIVGKNTRQAVRAGIGTLAGLLGGTVLKLGIEILMIIYFFITI